MDIENCGIKSFKGLNIESFISIENIEIIYIKKINVIKIIDLLIL